MLSSCAPTFQTEQCCLCTLCWFLAEGSGLMLRMLLCGHSMAGMLMATLQLGRATLRFRAFACVMCNLQC